MITRDKLFATIYEKMDAFPHVMALLQWLARYIRSAMMPQWCRHYTYREDQNCNTYYEPKIMKTVLRDQI